MCGGRLRQGKSLGDQVFDVPLFEQLQDRCHVLAVGAGLSLLQAGCGVEGGRPAGGSRSSSFTPRKLAMAVTLLRRPFLTARDTP